MTNPTYDKDSYQKKLEEAKKGLLGDFSTPLAKTAEESITRAIKKDDTLARLSKDELEEKRKEAQKALGGAYDAPPKKIYSTLEHRALLRAETISKILKEKDSHAQKQTETTYKKPIGTTIMPPKVTPDQEAFGTHLEKYPNVPRFDLKSEIFDTHNQTTKQIEVPIETKNREETTGKKSSLAQLAIEEQKRRSALEQSGYYKEARNRQYIILGVASLLVVTSMGLIIYNFFARTNVVIPTQKNTSEYIITPNSVQSIPFEPASTLSSRFSSAVTDVLIDSGSIQAIRITKSDDKENVVPINELFSTLSIFPPEELSQSLKEEYMIGIYGGKSNYAFLITRVNSFSASFESLLAWEKTSLPALYTLLTASARNPLDGGAVWKDVFIKNIDARILENRTQDIFLVYSFLDKNTLVIAPSIDTFIEVVGRFKTSEQIVR